MCWALTAPRGVELDQDELVVLDGGLEVLGGEDEDALLLGDVFGERRGGDEEDEGKGAHGEAWIEGDCLAVFTVGCTRSQMQSTMLQYVQFSSEAITEGVTGKE